MANSIFHKTHDPKAFRAIVINDPHYAAQSPPTFKINYLEYLENNIDQVFRAALKHSVDAILWGGDMFHLREPRSNPHWLVARVVKRLKATAEANLVHLAIGGNHDYKFGSIETGLKGSPLEVLIESGTISLLDDNEHEFHTGNSSDPSIVVRVAGGSYHHGQAEHVRDKKKSGADVLIVLGHFWLGTQTGEFYGEKLYGFDFFENSEADIICVGHHHEDKGVFDYHGRQFVSHGSIGITGAHGHDLTRRPAAALIEITGKYLLDRKTTLLRPKQPPIEELLDLQKHEEIKKERKEVDEFIQTLSNTKLTTADPSAVLQELAPPREIKERAENYLAQAEQNH